jgi:cytochrome b involved in lipid metabolism
MGWIRFSSDRNLAGVSNVPLRVTMEELAKHNKIDDCWTAIQGKYFRNKDME